MYQNRFKQIHIEKLNSTAATEYMEIIKDLNTGVLYCIACNGSLAMTPLLDSNGNPIIDKSE